VKHRTSPRQADPPDEVDINLFAGAGGLALGLRDAGFRPEFLYEVDNEAWATLKHNSVADPPPGWDEHQGDVRKVDWKAITQPVRLIAAGVPCQPFSLAGKHLADQDGRNMFPELFRAVSALMPRAVLLENVAGLTREKFRPYFDYILRRLEYPTLCPRSGELWEDHDARLRIKQSSKGYEPAYEVTWAVMNAADFGVPQNRRRVFMVATRRGEGAYVFPRPTHSRKALYASQKSGDYWDRHCILKPGELPLRPTRGWQEDELEPWITVRDAIADLPKPACDPKAAIANHFTIPGARSYPGHTGSNPDLPSKTIKAGVNGVPGGENTIQLNGHGEVRYYTLREAATLQTFPFDHVFLGPRKRVTRQIGNAVPCSLSQVVAAPILQALSAEHR
jgi:DNA (cytosine-5)-methyltransferase 1